MFSLTVLSSDVACPFPESTPEIKTNSYCIRNAHVVCGGF